MELETSATVRSHLFLIPQMLLMEHTIIIMHVCPHRSGNPFPVAYTLSFWKPVENQGSSYCLIYAVVFYVVENSLKDGILLHVMHLSGEI